MIKALVLCVLFLPVLAGMALADGPLFTSSIHYKVGFEPYKVCIADFNSDGINDIACAHSDGDSIAVLLGKGAGLYEATAFYDVGTYQYDIKAANIDDDVDIDLIVATGSVVYTLENAGNGTFGSADQISGLTNSPQTIELALVDGDSDYDLIVAHNDWMYTKLTVWDNDGFGNFTLHDERTVGAGQRVLAVADFDGDLSPDIAVGTDAPDFSILINDGNGNYTIEDTYVLAYVPQGMCAGTFDGDAINDLAISTFGSVTIYTNGGAGAFSFLSSRGILGRGFGLTAADLDGANGPDLAMLDDRVQVLFNDGTGTFSPADGYWVGDEGTDIAIGKLDNDDCYDIAAIGWPGNSEDAVGHIAVLLNPQGDGQFMVPIQTKTCEYSMSLCGADFNGDGNVDVASLEYWNDSVIVLLGDGAGGFTGSFRYPVGNSPYEIIAAELDGMNTEDLIIGYSDPTQSYVSVLLSNGDGTFGIPSNYTVGLRPRGVFAADLDGVNGLDIATTNSTDQSISVLLNNGIGGFSSAISYPCVSSSYHSAIDGGDFDADGDIDLVVPNHTDNCVQVYLNDGAGGFSYTNNVAIGMICDPYQVCVDDLDYDGFDDIIVGSYDSTEVAVIMATGSGFDSPDYYYAGWEQIEIHTSDFNNDGDNDIVVLNHESYNSSVFFGDGMGNFSSPVHYGSVSDDSEGFAVADFDGDGDEDLAVSDYNSGTVAILFNLMYGFDLPTFVPASDYTVGVYPSSVFSTDLDGDGDRDLGVANTEDDNVSILTNYGDGTYATAVNYAVNDAPTSVVGADLDGDGDKDLAVANSGSDNASVLMNHGDATFEGAVDYGVGTGARAVCLTDCDGDADWDMVVANSDDDDISILLNKSDGTFATAVDYSVGDYPTSVCATDFDGDTDKDLAVANYNSDNVSILTNRGDATFDGAVDYGVGTGARSVVTCDLDGDGDFDLAVANSDSDDISILLNNSDATFAAAVQYPAGDYPASVYAGDIDGDGDNDLVVANHNSDSVSVLINHGDATFEGAVDYGVGTGPRAICLTDCDGDGDYDIVTANCESDDVSILLNQTDEPVICCELRGDFNRDDQVDILDIDEFIDLLFREGAPPVCEEEVDMDESGQLNILDIDYMIDYLFRDGPDPIPCP